MSEGTSSALAPAPSSARRSMASIRAKSSPKRLRPANAKRSSPDVAALSKGDAVILQKFWSAFVAQINKVANLFWEADPIAQMRYEYDKAVEQLKEGRTGLEQYRGLVERVTRQVQGNKSHVSQLEAQTKASLKAGDRTTAAKFALE